MKRKNGDIGAQTDREVRRGPGLVVVDGKIRKVKRGSNRPSR